MNIIINKNMPATCSQIKQEYEVLMKQAAGFVPIVADVAAKKADFSEAKKRLKELAAAYDSLLEKVDRYDLTLRRRVFAKLKKEGALSVGKFYEGMAEVTFAGNREAGEIFYYRYVDRAGKIVGGKYEKTTPFSCGRAFVKVSGGSNSYTLIDKAGNRIGDNSFADIGEFEDGLAQVDYVTGAKQLINMSNQPVGDTYWEIGPFRDGVAKVKFGGGLFGYIDKTGKTIGRINGQYARAQDFYNGHAAVSDLHGFQFVNSAGEKVLPETTYSQVHVPVDGIRRVKKDGRFFFLDKNLHEIAGPFAFACDFGCGVAWVKEKNRYSLIDQRGVMVSGELTYSHVSGFHAGYGMAATEAGWIFVNKQGQRVGKECLPSSLNFDSSGFAVLRVPKQYIIIFHASGRRVGDGVYTGVLGFREGRCVVESFDAEAGRVFNWYAIDEDGKRISRENFAAMDSFHNGVSVVTLKNNERACIDRDGKRIFEQ